MKKLKQNMIYKWRLDRLSGENDFDKRIRELQTQCNEYSSILDVLGKITSLTNKREAIEKIIELYQIVFGARQIKYWSCDFGKEHIPDDIAGFFSCMNNHLFFNDENRFLIKVQWNNKLYGAIEFADFVNPLHIVRYLNHGIEIAKICGVIFANIDQYEMLIKSQKEVKYAGYHDTLTGLYNRTYLNVLLEREADDYDMTVFLFEIEKLKAVNDGFGHTEGDKLIKNVAESLKKSFRETDYLLRSGGDEFIAILPQADQKTAETVRKRIEEELAAQNSSGIPSHLKVKLSMGYATTDDNYDTLSDLIHLADERMCAEKQKKG